MNTAEWWLTFGGVLLLGLQTSISPCPMTTNIAAISYIAKRVGKPREVLFSGFLYMLGQTFSFVTLSFCVLCVPIFSGDQLTRFFAVTVGIFLGPLMILIGMMLTGMFHFSIPGVNEQTLRKIVERFGMWSAFPLGMVFAVAFCPTTAATFLGMLTLAAQAKSWFLFPICFGVSATLPLCVLAGVIAYHFRLLSEILQAARNVDIWTRNLTGTLFIAAGIYLTLRHNFTI